MSNIISRNEAQAAGLTKYFTGIPCRRGHVAERYVSMGGCLMCLSRHVTRTAISVFMPLKPVYLSATALEAQAVFRYVEAAGWYSAALKAIRENPALLKECTSHLSATERTNLAAADHTRSVLSVTGPRYEQRR